MLFLRLSLSGGSQRRLPQPRLTGWTSPNPSFVFHPRAYKPAGSRGLAFLRADEGMSQARSIVASNGN